MDSRNFDFYKGMLIESAVSVHNAYKRQLDHMADASQKMMAATTVEELEQCVDQVFMAIRNAPQNARTDLLIKYLTGAAVAETREAMPVYQDLLRAMEEQKI